MPDYAKLAEQARQSTTVDYDALAAQARGDDPPKPSASDPYGFGQRPDGTAKGLGFLGPLKTRDGGVASEYSFGTSDVNGKEMDIPVFVPTLTKAEVQIALNAASSGGDVPRSIRAKAVDFAKQRVKAGKPVFALEGEQRADLYPEIARADVKRIAPETPGSATPGPDGSALSRFAAPFVETARGLSDAVNVLNPLQMIAQGGAPLTRTIDRVKAMGQAQVDELDKAGHSASIKESLAHTAAGILPVVGPMAAHIGEQAGAGDYAGAAGNATLLALPEVARVPAVRAGAARAGRAASAGADVAVRGAKTAVRAAGPFVAPVAGGVVGATVGSYVGHPVLGAELGFQGGRMVNQAIEGRPAPAPMVPPSPPEAILDRAIAKGKANWREPTATVPPRAATAPAPAPPTPASPAPRPAPASPTTPTTPAMSPARIRNEVGLAARRANAEFSEAELAAADTLVSQGKSPVAAVLEVKAQRAATSAPVYEEDVVHVTTPAGAAGIRAHGYDVSKSGSGIGGDAYGPGVYLSDARRDAGSFWRSELETKNESGRLASEAMTGRVGLHNPLKFEDVDYSGRGRESRRAVVSRTMPGRVSDFERMVADGMSENAALGKIAREQGYDGLVMQRRGGDEIVAFDPSSVSFKSPSATLAVRDLTPAEVKVYAQQTKTKAPADVLAGIAAMRELHRMGASTVDAAEADIASRGYKR